MNTVSMGRIVFYREGGRESPAIVTRVLNEENLVNLTIFEDTMAPSPRECVSQQELVGEHDSHVWRWPPRTL
jgi:hypothetical protein